MKKSLKALLLSFVTVLLALSIFSTEADQCVRCVAAPPGWMCMSGAGGEGCITDGISCTLINPCFPEGNRMGTESKCSAKVLTHSLVNVPDEMIRDIGLLNPQAALALISVRNIKMEFNEGRVNLFPIKLTTEDVEKHLTLPKSSDYFEAQEAKIREAFANAQAPIGYEFFLNRDDNANAFSLRIKAVSPTGTPSSFEINLSKVSAGRGEDESIRFDATSWRVN